MRSRDLRRREFLTVPVKSLGGLLLYTLSGEPVRLQAQEGEVRIPLRFFTEAEARVVQAVCARIFPAMRTVRTPRRPT